MHTTMLNEEGRANATNKRTNVNDMTTVLIDENAVSTMKRNEHLDDNDDNKKEIYVISDEDALESTKIMATLK